MNKKLNLFQQVRELEDWRAVAFAVTLLERMLPNYQLFCETTDFADSKVLRNLLDNLWEWLAQPKTKLNFAVRLENVEEITPDTNSFENYGVYPALDCTMSFAATLHLLMGEDQQGAVVVSKLSQGTVEAFIEVTSEDDLSNEQIRNHPLMQWEISLQAELLDLLTTGPRDKAFINQLRKLAIEEGISNIGIEIESHG